VQQGPWDGWRQDGVGGASRTRAGAPEKTKASTDHPSHTPGKKPRPFQKMAVSVL